MALCPPGRRGPTGPGQSRGQWAGLGQLCRERVCALQDRGCNPSLLVSLQPELRFPWQPGPSPFQAVEESLRQRLSTARLPALSSLSEMALLEKCLRGRWMGAGQGGWGEGQCLSRPEPRCPSEWRLSQGTSSQGHSRRVSFFPSSGAGEGKGGTMDSTSSWLRLP